MNLQQDLVNRIAALERRVQQLEEQLKASAYKGEQAADLSTTELPYPGDFGTQTNDNEVQVNINGTVRAITTAAL